MYKDGQKLMEHKTNLRVLVLIKYFKTKLRST